MSNHRTGGARTPHAPGFSIAHRLTNATHSDYTRLMNGNAPTPTQAETIACGTKSGSKAHLASPNSSVTHCGHWLKFQAKHYRLSSYDLAERDCCERCGGKEAFDAALK